MKVGDVFERLTLIEYKGRNSRSKIIWLCLCKCGKYTTPEEYHLKKGIVKSCGCYSRDNFKNNVIFKHGLARHPLYAIWTGIRQRCLNEKAKEYKWYGGRGIKLCDRWLDFSLFAKDMGDRPSLKHSIERKNVNGHYEKDNCTWGTREVQSRNRTNNFFITYKGETLILKDWAKKLNMKYPTLQRYIKIMSLDEIEYILLLNREKYPPYE